MTYQRDPDPVRRNPIRWGRTDDNGFSWLSGLVGVVLVVGLIVLGYSLLNSGPEGRRSTAEAPRANTPATPAPTTPAPPNR